MALFTGCITTVPTKNRNGAPYTLGEGKNASLFPPNGWVNGKIACGSDMVTVYISSYLYAPYTEILQVRPLYQT